MNMKQRQISKYNRSELEVLKENLQANGRLLSCNSAVEVIQFLKFNVRNMHTAGACGERLYDCHAVTSSNNRVASQCLGVIHITEKCCF